MTHEMEPVHVLCIDDNPDMRIVLRMLIDKTDGLSCVGTLETAKNLTTEAVTRDADVVLLDLGLPDCDSLEEMRALARTGAAKIIVLSGTSDPEVTEQSIAAGAAACLCKGMHPRALVETILDVAAGDR
jgi:DNA-binding NarL/FixJ family response regulator